MKYPSLDAAARAFRYERADLVRTETLPDCERLDVNGQSFARDKQVVLLRRAGEYPRAYVRVRDVQELGA